MFYLQTTDLIISWLLFSTVIFCFAVSLFCCLRQACTQYQITRHCVGSHFSSSFHLLSFVIQYAENNIQTICSQFLLPFAYLWHILVSSAVHHCQLRSKRRRLFNAKEMNMNLEHQLIRSVGLDIVEIKLGCSTFYES